MSLLYYICTFHIAGYFLQHGTVLLDHHIQHWTDNRFPWVQICMAKQLLLRWSSIVRFVVVPESFVVHLSPDILHIPRLLRTCLISRNYKNVYIGNLPVVGIWLCYRARRWLSSLDPRGYILPTYLLHRSFFSARESLLDLEKCLNVLICLMLLNICRTDEPEHVIRLIILDEIRLIRTVTRNSSVAVKILVKAFILRFFILVIQWVWVYLVLQMWVWVYLVIQM